MDIFTAVSIGGCLADRSLSMGTFGMGSDSYYSSLLFIALAAYSHNPNIGNPSSQRHDDPMALVIRIEGLPERSPDALP